MTNSKRSKTRAYIAIFIIVIFLLSTIWMWLLYLLDDPVVVDFADFEAQLWDMEVPYIDLNELNFWLPVDWDYEYDINNIDPEMLENLLNEYDFENNENIDLDLTVEDITE